jgi:hypothetical protein
MDPTKVQNEIECICQKMCNGDSDNELTNVMERKHYPHKETANSSCPKKKSENLQEQIKKKCSQFSLKSKGLFANNSPRQAKQSIPHTVTFPTALIMRTHRPELL